MCSRPLAVAVVLTIIALAGCTPGICGRTSDCATGLQCTTAGACVVPPVDAGADDATTVADSVITPIRDADGDALGIEPIDAAPAGDGNDIDAPDDNGLRGPR